MLGFRPGVEDVLTVEPAMPCSAMKARAHFSPRNATRASIARPVALRDRVDHRLDLLPVGHVDVQEGYRPARGDDLVDDALSAGVVDIGDDHVPALRGDLPGDRLADTTGRAGDVTGLAVEPSHRRTPVVLRSSVRRRCAGGCSAFTARSPYWLPEPTTALAGGRRSAAGP